MLNIDTSRSYATEAQLVRALEKRGLGKLFPLIVRNREGRWTAVFGVSNLQGNITLCARQGFMTIG